LNNFNLISSTHHSVALCPVLESHCQNFLYKKEKY